MLDTYAHPNARLGLGQPYSPEPQVLNTPIFGESHWLSDVKLSFRYLAGYTPPAGHTKNVGAWVGGCSVRMSVVVDGLSGCLGQGPDCGEVL